MQKLFSNCYFLRNLKYLFLFFSFLVFAADMHLPSTDIKTVQPNGLTFTFSNSQPTSLVLPSMSTTTRGNFLSNTEGQFIYNLTNHIPEYWNGSSWTSAGSSAVLTTLGDMLYENSTPANARLPGNTTSTKKYLSQTGTGTISAAPVWLQPACGDLSNAAASCSTDTTNASNISSGTLGAARLPNPTSSTLGGVQSAAAVSHQWINSISTLGVPSLSQPAFSDVSGVCTIAQGCTNNGSLAVTAGGVLYTDGTKVVNVGAGTTGQALKSNGSSAPTWGAVAGSGVKNYLTSYIASTSSGTPNTGNGDFELGTTTGWALGTTGTLTNGLPTGSPTFGSGASGNLSIGITNAGAQIAATASLTYSQAISGTVAGNMLATSAFFIDKEDQGGILSYTLKYFAATSPGNANWSGTSSNSFAVAVYDVTNSAWIPVSNPFGLVQSSGVGSVSGTFQVPTNTTQLRFVVYNANATSGTITMYFDDATVGPSTGSSSASSVISWYGTQSSQAVTANVTDIAFTTVKDSSAAWNGTQYVVTVAGDYLLAGSVVSSGAATPQVYRNGSVYTNGFLVTAQSSNAGGGSMLITGCKAGDTISLRMNGSVTVTNGSLGIFQLGGGAVGPAGQVVAARYFLTSNQSLPSGDTQLTGFSLSYDTASLLSGNAFLAPISGKYNLNFQVLTNSGAFVIICGYKINGGSTVYVGTNVTGPARTGGSDEVNLNAGDLVTFIVNSASGTSNASSGTTNTFWSMSLIQGASQSNNAFVAPTVQTLTSGTSQTYTTPQSPRKPLYLKVKLVGGGGGGGEGGTTGGTASTVGGDTIFGTSTAGGGGRGLINDRGPLGGTATVGSGLSGFGVAGGSGGAAETITSGSAGGGMGGSSCLGGGGGGGGTTNVVAPRPGATNTGGGGGGGNAGGGGFAGSGGGSGACVELVISNPSSTYTYTVGAGGVGGIGNQSTGGAGGSGIIVVEEHYQ